MTTPLSYTLQPVPYEVSVEEQRHAQLMMLKSSNKISNRTWAILGALTAIAILCLIFIKNYSTIFSWVILAGVITFILVRIYGFEWYAKRKMNEVPIQEISGVKLGIQPFGMVMQQKMGMQQATGNIAWKDVDEWYDHPEFLLMTFKVKGQQGSFFLPKRMNTRQFSFDTIRKHLTETVGSPKNF
ncbi:MULTISPECIES: hypothetical protein [unclassified Acinetobacter]|uniref:hypothetical protein n=1 Tax=unclassified Acinetobacter TaxID=196816 RepID=UPI0035B857E4